MYIPSSVCELLQNGAFFFIEGTKTPKSAAEVSVVDLRIRNVEEKKREEKETEE